MRSFWKVAIPLMAIMSSLAVAVTAQVPKLPTTKPNTTASVDAPRWPPDQFFVFDSFGKRNANPHPYRGTILFTTEGGAGNPQMFEGGWEGPGVKVVDKLARQIAANYWKAGVRFMALDRETWPRDPRVNTDAEIEKTNQHYRRIMQLWREGAPGMQVGIYNVINRDYWVTSNYFLGVAAWEKMRREEKLTDDDLWAIGKVADRDWNKNGKEAFTWNDKKEWVVGYRDWKASNDRLSWGYDTRKKRNDNYGAYDAVDFIAPDCYLFYNRALKGGAKGLAEDIAADNIYLRENIREAKRVAAMNGNKPVVVYQMCYIHEGSVEEALIKDAKGNVIGYNMEMLKFSDERWLNMLRIIKEEKVHLVIWGWDYQNAYVDHLFELAIANVSTLYTPPPATQPVVQPVKPKPSADFNSDGVVNFDDLLKLSQNYGKKLTHTEGDADYDGDVDFDDLLLLSQAYKGNPADLQDVLKGKSPATQPAN